MKWNKNLYFQNRFHCHFHCGFIINLLPRTAHNSRALTQRSDWYNFSMATAHSPVVHLCILLEYHVAWQSRKYILWVRCVGKSINTDVELGNFVQGWGAWEEVYLPLAKHHWIICAWGGGGGGGRYSPQILVGNCAAAKNKPGLRNELQVEHDNSRLRNELEPFWAWKCGAPDRAWAVLGVKMRFSGTARTRLMTSALAG